MNQIARPFRLLGRAVLLKNEANRKIMRIVSLLFIAILYSGCKNNGSSTANETKVKAEKNSMSIKDISIDQNRGPAATPDFSVLKWMAKGDVLEVIVRYSGGCEEHEFNAYFSGSWMKSLPAKAVIELEHLNPKNDACRSLIKDTLMFNLQPIQYPGGKEVVVKWSGDPLLETTYRYAK